MGIKMSPGLDITQVEFCRLSLNIDFFYDFDIIHTLKDILYVRDEVKTGWKFSIFTL